MSHVYMNGSTSPVVVEVKHVPFEQWPEYQKQAWRRFWDSMIYGVEKAERKEKMEQCRTGITKTLTPGS
jgi:hypothetical protein